MAEGGDCKPNPNEEQMEYDELQRIAHFLRKRTEIRPVLGIICGSGLGGMVDELDSNEDRVVIPYKEIEGFPKCQVKGHAGNFVFGYLSGKPVLCMQGRFHFYEGHPPWKVAMPVRVMKLLGVHTLVVTNAAGGLNPEFKAGDIMLIKDHINLAGMTGHNPLRGNNEERFGPRFPAMTEAYNRDLRLMMKDAVKELGMSDFFHEGVYVHLSGPNYETPSESMFLRTIGADAVGMSTVPEALVAVHCGMKVLGLSLITNMVIVEHDSDKEPPTHSEVMETGQKRALDMQKLVKKFAYNLA